jgi:hypothetical protein
VTADGASNVGEVETRPYRKSHWSHCECNVRNPPENQERFLATSK